MADNELFELKQSGATVRVDGISLLPMLHGEEKSFCLLFQRFFENVVSMFSSPSTVSFARHRPCT